MAENNCILVDELNKAQELFAAGLPMQICKAWVLVEELSQAFIYLEEIMCEHRIKGGMDKKESIGIFQQKKREIILNNIDKLKEMLA